MIDGFKGREWSSDAKKIQDLMTRLEAYLEADDGLGFDVGSGSEVIEFLAGLGNMADVEVLLSRGAFTKEERETILNLVEDKMHRPLKTQRWLR